MTAHSDYEDPQRESYRAELDRLDDERRIETWKQDRAEARLTAEERRIACGCLSTFVLQMGHDLRKGELTDEGAARYREDMRTAGSAIAKLMGGAA